MAERIGKAFNDTKGNNRQSVPPYQSAWVARWMHTNRNTAVETSNRSGEELANRDRSLTNRLEAPVPVRWGVIESKPLEIVNEDLRASSKSSRNELCSSVVKHGRDSDDVVLKLSTVSGRNQDCGKAVEGKSEIQFPSLISRVPVALGTSSRRQGEGTSKNPLELMETHSSAKDSSLAVSKPLPKTLVESSSCIVPCTFNFEKCDPDKGKATLSSFKGRSASFPDTFKMLENEHFREGSQSVDVVLERNLQLDMFNAPSTSGHQLRKFGPEWFQKCSGVGQFLSQYTAPDSDKQEKSPYVHSSLQESPNCVHDVEIARVCTTVDSVEELPGSCPRISQTTHSLLFTKKTDINLLKENDVFRSTRAVTKINDNKSSDLYRLSPFFSQGNRGVTLKSLSNSTDSEGKGNFGDREASKVSPKNESSAETDTMDMDLFKEKKSQSVGTNSTASTKVMDMGSNMPPLVDVALPREIGSRNTGLPDINLELPPSSDEASLPENICRGSSRTQSLDMDMLLAHAEQLKPEATLNQNDSSKEDPSSRWVKRLKCSSPMSSPQGTKSSSLAEMSHDKISKFYAKILKSRINNSQPTPRKPQDKETTPLDKTGDLSKKDEDFSAEPAESDEELLLSHSWIQRWLCSESRIALKKPETAVISEPQSSKLALDDLPKKQFPSIAAMALLGKAMNGFQECELQKRGSFTVWNTKSF